MNKVSIIIRSKNEEQWIFSCLKRVLNQTYENKEIVVVDSGSTDHTLSIVQSFNVSLLSYPKDRAYRPGNALNVGIKYCKADFYVFLSAHCIPKDDYWLSQLVEDLESRPNCAGVYGKQEPLSYSKEVDKRDLAIVFGMDSKIQYKDPFFHNANSIIRHEALYPNLFDEEVTNIEDRIWGAEVISKGWQLYYSARSIVYHYHGIHHSNNKARLQSTSKVLGDHLALRNTATSMYLEDTCRFCIIFSLRDIDATINDEDLILRFRLAFSTISQIVGGYDLILAFAVSDYLYSRLAKLIASEFPYFKDSIHLNREAYLDDDWVSILDVLMSIESQIPNPFNYFCYLDIGYVFRSSGDLERAFSYVQNNFMNQNKSTVCFRSTQKRSLFHTNDSCIQDIISESFRPRSHKMMDDVVSFYMHPGYCSIFERSSIIDSSICPSELKMMEAQDELAYIKPSNVKDIIKLLSL